MLSFELRTQGHRNSGWTSLRLAFAPSKRVCTLGFANYRRSWMSSIPNLLVQTFWSWAIFRLKDCLQGLLATQSTFGNGNAAMTFDSKLQDTGTAARRNSVTSTPVEPHAFAYRGGHARKEKISWTRDRRASPLSRTATCRRPQIIGICILE